ncbi:uncharacterized protein DS421_6g187620 [Arachis hypogaea]|nr:uncharacterized protein DS421_6g187620 [Arachis hypogaea]
MAVVGVAVGRGLAKKKGQKMVAEAPNMLPSSNRDEEQYAKGDNGCRCSGEEKEQRQRGGCNHQTAMRVILKSQSMWTVGEVKNRSEIDISLLLTGNDRSGQAYPSEAVRAESF